MADVVTRGTGEHEVIADQAELWVSFAGRGADRPGAVAELGSRVAPAEPLFTMPGVEVRTRRMAVHTAWEDRRKAGCRAELSITLRVHELDVLEELLGALVAADPESLHGPMWRLADETAATELAQRHAVEDARRRAAGYAAALGARLGPLVSISDAGLERPMHREVTLAAAAPAAAPTIQDLGLEPAPVTVTVACTTVWTLLD